MSAERLQPIRRNSMIVRDIPENELKGNGGRHMKITMQEIQSDSSFKSDSEFEIEDIGTALEVIEETN